MTKDVILIGDVVARGATMLELRCGRCERHGRLSVQRLLAQYGPDAPVRQAWLDRITDCPNRDSPQIQNRRDPFCPRARAAVRQAQAAVIPASQCVIC